MFGPAIPRARALGLALQRPWRGWVKVVWSPPWGRGWVKVLQRPWRETG